MIKVIIDSIKKEGAGTDKAEAELKELGFVIPRTALKNLRLLAATPIGAHLEVVIESAAASPSPDGALNNLEGIAKTAPIELLRAALRDPADVKRLITVTGSSPMLSSTLVKNPGYLKWLFTDGGLSQSKDLSAYIDELKGVTEGVDEFDPMARVIRVYKEKEYLRLGARDLLGLTTLEELTGELSDLAAASLEAAIAFTLKTLKRAFGVPLGEDGTEAEISVIALGKFGGRELNFSSDIDILFVYSTDRGGTTGVEGREGGTESRITLHDFFVKTSTMITKLISSVTGDGFVFRVDLDLRPEGRSGAMANSLAGAESYYEIFGQTWERSAMIKARPVAGSASVGEAYLEMIRPFVYRRYLDFTAIEEIKSMKEKIDLSLVKTRPDAVNVKLGVGGIREVEFFCQALQLIHGGKEKGVRGKNTLKVLEKLTELDYLKKTYAEALKNGYVFLRNLEHRIQIVEGRQSQVVPAQPRELERLARMMGFKDTERGSAGDFFWQEYKEVTGAIHEIYKSLFYGAEEEAPEVPEDVLMLFLPDIPEEEAKRRLTSAGFKDAGNALKIVTGLKSSTTMARLSPRARVLLDRLAPVFVHKASVCPNPDRALVNLEGFLSSVGARTAYYSLMAENPRVTEELLKIFGTSEFLSRNMIERPENLDMLLSKELSIPLKTMDEFSEEFRSGVLTPGKDYEERLDDLRRIRNQEIIRIGMNDIVRGLSTEEISGQITGLADAALETSYRVAREELERTYGSPEKARFAVFGLGKLGGGELIYGSDLDIIFVYSDVEEGTHTVGGTREISTHEFFVKLCQRIISVLTLRTQEGHLFNVDTRLRPSGSSGPLVVSKSSLVKYHKAKTSTWERQAFTKVRVAAGDLAFGAEVLEELLNIIYSKPLTVEDANEMLRIRKRMEVEIAKEDASRYNVKTGRGGIVDIEFLTQALQLRYGGVTPSLRTPVTLSALDALAAVGLLAEEDHAALKKAYAFFRMLETRQRIVHDRPEGYIETKGEELSTLARRAGYSGPEAPGRLLTDYRGFAEKVRSIYLKTLEGLAKTKDR
jgi:glutamate-ammonia-ligase adenylyltransferase